MAIDKAGKLRTQQKQADEIKLALESIMGEAKMAAPEPEGELKKSKGNPKCLDMIPKLKTRIDVVILLIILQTILYCVLR